ncbi:hypothetical protein FRC01_003033 [Tulasnella sp. 417]|nr:hypothetical protein FRC01_003033 [Tulasnella sp. 417]
MPPEMLFLIVSHLGMADKACLLATCQYLRQLAEPLLYRFLSPDDTWKSDRRIRLLTTLGKRQDLLPSVRSFRGFLIPSSIRGPNDVYPLEQFGSGYFIPYPLEPFGRHDLRPKQEFEDKWLEIVVPLFTQAVNIRNLDLTGKLNWGEIGRWQLLSGIVSNLKLDRFALDSPASGQLDFIPLLRGQPGLTRLELNCPKAEFEGLTMEDVPQLAYFKGTLSQAAEIVPGRPVRKLEVTCALWDEFGCLDEHKYQALALSSGPVKELEMVAHYGTGGGEVKRMLQLITQHLPNIVHFTANLPYGVSNEVLLDEIPKLTSLSHLMLLDFNPDGMPRMSLDTSVECKDRWHHLCEKLIKLCPSLTDIQYTPRVVRYARCGTVTTSEYLRQREYL